MMDEEARKIIRDLETFPTHFLTFSASIDHSSLCSPSIITKKMVDSIVSNVTKQLGTIVQKEMEQEIRLVVGVEKDIKKLTRTFTMIRAVLKDAEKKQFMDELVRLWLQDLKDMAYDIDDVLDEWSTAILKSQLEQVDDEHAVRSISLSKKVCSFSNLFSPCFCFKRIGLRHDIGHRIKEINERLDQIANDQNKFGFIRNVQTNRNEIIDKSRRKIVETSSLVDAREVFGRDMDRNTIISELLSEGSSQQEKEVVSLSDGVIRRIPMIISIVGMGGLGKSTLAQIVFNDDRVKNHFNKRVWVYVSKSFDRVKVAMDIIREMSGSGNIGTTTQGLGGHDIAWEAVHHQLTSCVNGKHFLLVLDDVWNEDPMLWDPLRISLQCGSQGSKIIVTTRNQNVAIMMGSGSRCVHRLGMLSDQDCWSILKYYAFDGRQEEECAKLEEIGMKLANKCNGLPLSVKTLGSLLRFKKSKHDWQYVLESDVWSTVSSTDNHVLPALLLSYDDLPSHLKQCFAYCSHIPKGTFHKRSMILIWMAQGFLSDSLAARSHEDFETVGGEYFDNLVMRSLFQKVVQSGTTIGHYGMHDLVFDFARSLLENESVTLSIRDSSTQEFNFNRARHLSLVIRELSIRTIPSFIHKAENLRTLQILGPIFSISSELFCHLKCLRVLCFQGTGIEELPNEIEKLIHLRYLNLSGTWLKELPKTVTGLYNLQALELSGCKNLCQLPEGIGRLVNLVYLGLVECLQLNYLPEGIGKLTKLRGLSNFIIGGVERGGCKIGELKDLNFLKDFLCIIGLDRLENGDEGKTACLKNKQHLRALYFYFNQYRGVSELDAISPNEEGEDREEEGDNIEEGEEEETVELEEEEVDRGDLLSRRMEDVLESLQPHPNLERLLIFDYLGTVFPNWMTSHADFISFSNLVYLELQWCRKCKKLPSTLGKLPSLETLVIGCMDQIKFIGVEFFGVDGATTNNIIFPKLKVFQLSAMPNLKEWDMRVEGDGKEFIFMPCLQYLRLGYLPKLRLFPQHLTTSLRKLMIMYCPKLSWRPSSSSHHPFQHVEELILRNYAGSFSKSLLVAPDNHVILPNLKLLCVRLSPYSSLPQGLGKLTSLEILDIRTSSKIKSMPEEELQYLTALKELRIMRCSALSRRCQKEIGEDWNKISHIPNIFIDGEKIK